MKHAYIKHFDSSNRKFFWVEVEVMAHEKAYGKDLSVIRPQKGEGHIRVNSDKIIIR